MTPFRIVVVPPPIRDRVVSQLLRCAKKLADNFLAYETAVKKQQPREHLVSALRLLNTQHEALVNVLTDLTRYNDKVRRDMTDFLQLEKERALGRVAQA